MPTKSQELADKVIHVAKSKNTRNILFLILAVLAVLLINSLLPLIEGGAHYTEDSVDMTYKEYKELKESNENYSLTWTTRLQIEQYKVLYIQDHEDVGAEQIYSIEPPDTFNVSVYTKFFFQYSYWWITTLTHVVSVLLIYYSVFNYILAKRKRTDQRYVDLLAEVDAASETQLDPVTFEPWMEDVFNMQRKRKQYVINTKFKLDKLERTTAYKVRHYTGKEKGLIYKRFINYKNKQATLNEQLGTEYIDRYIDTVKVKGYKRIYPSFVTSGYNAVDKNVDNYSLVKSDAKKLSEDSVKKVIGAVLITTLFAVLLTYTISASIDKPWYWIVLNIVIKIAPMAIQVPSAYDYCDAFMEDQLITNLVFRRSIALLYLADMSKNKGDTNGN